MTDVLLFWHLKMKNKIENWVVSCKAIYFVQSQTMLRFFILNLQYESSL